MLSLEVQALGGRPLAAVASEVAINRWMSAVALALICYDTMLTLPEEVQFLWPKRWSDVKVLTYLNRFVSFFFIIINAYVFVGTDRSLSNSFCEVLVISTGVAAYLCFAMSNWILLARANALLSGHRILKPCLLALYIFLYLATAGLVIKTSRDIKGQLFYSKTVRSCGVASRPLDMVVVWVGPMLFETTIFVATLLKLYQNALRTYALGSKLLIVLYRDGVCYYLIIIGLRIFTFTSWIAFPVSLLFVTFFVLWAAMSIAITRLQINLRKAIDLELPLDTQDAQDIPPPGSKRDEASVMLIWGENPRGITSTLDIQLRSISHHAALSDSRHVDGAQIDNLARASTIYHEDEYRRMEERESWMQSRPNEGSTIVRPASRVVPMGPRVLRRL